MSMLDAWMKQTHGSKEKMLQNEQKFLDQVAFDKKRIENIRMEQACLMSERSATSLSEYLGYKKTDLKPTSKEGQVSYFKNYDFNREKSLRDFRRFDDGIEMGDMGSEDCK